MILVFRTQHLIMKQLQRWVNTVRTVRRVLSEARGHGTEADPADPTWGRQDVGAKVELQLTH